MYIYYIWLTVVAAAAKWLIELPQQYFGSLYVPQRDIELCEENHKESFYVVVANF